MGNVAGLDRMVLDQNKRLTEVVAQETSRLRAFIGRRVRDARDADDVLQDVLSALVEANRLLTPIEHVTAWLFRVARNRIADLFRTRRPEPLAVTYTGDLDEAPGQLDDLLPSPDAGPDVRYAHQVLLQELELALDELPEDQRAVFVAHEIDGQTFKEIAEATGVSVNTLLSRKHYAVRRLRARLRQVYDDMTGA